jgi:hypothetical protein
MRQRRTLLWMLLMIFFLGAVLAVYGCSKVNKENYEKLSLGMDYGNVVTILGKPDNCQEKLGTKSCIWGSEAKNISLKFVADKLVYRSKEGL